MNFVLLITILRVFLIPASDSQNNNGVEIAAANRNGEITLPEDYNKFHLPLPKRCQSEWNSTIDVQAYLAISSIGDVNEIRQVKFTNLLWLSIITL